MPRPCLLRAAATTAALAAVALHSATACAAAQRTFVASWGSDVGPPPCSLSQPCRSFNVAIGQTLPGGEVVILDTAGYGPMVINKAIKVIGPSGVYGGISVLGGVNPTTGIVINAGSGDDVILRGLDVSGVPGVAGPFPDIGIDIQNAGAVHIEKSSIGNFNQATSVCINVNSSNTVRVFVVDSFLRECRSGIRATGPAVIANRPSVTVDNTRIERGRGPVIAVGVWMQGPIDVSLRNSVIVRQDVAIQFDGLLAGGGSQLNVINTEVTRASTGLQLTNTTNASAQVVIVGSQFVATGTSGSAIMQVSSSGVGGNTLIQVADSLFAHAAGDGLALTCSAADVNTGIALSMIRSQLGNIPAGAALTLNATNGCDVGADIRDSTFFAANTLLKTSGSASSIEVSLVRSHLHHSITAIDHGQGLIGLESTHVNYNDRDFVNSGSGNIVSNSQNMVYNNTNAPGPIYITPNPVTPK